MPSFIHAPYFIIFSQTAIEAQALLTKHTPWFYVDMIA